MLCLTPYLLPFSLQEFLCRDYIIELNDSMMGLSPEHWREDSLVLRDLVMDRMDAIYVKGEHPRPLFNQLDEPTDLYAPNLFIFS